MGFLIRVRTIGVCCKNVELNCEPGLSLSILQYEDGTNPRFTLPACGFGGAEASYGLLFRRSAFGRRNDSYENMGRC